MSHDDDTALATRKPTAKRKPLAGTGGRVSGAFERGGGERPIEMPTRQAAKSIAIQERILEALKGSPMSILEIAKTLDHKNPVALTRQLRLLMQSQHVRAFLEIPRENVERIAFVRSEEAPSGLWDRTCLRGYECITPRRGLVVPPKRKAPKTRRQLALEIIDKAAALPKRQEALALEMTRQATKALLEEDSK